MLWDESERLDGRRHKGRGERFLKMKPPLKCNTLRRLISRRRREIFRLGGTSPACSLVHGERRRSREMLVQSRQVAIRLASHLQATIRDSKFRSASASLWYQIDASCTAKTCPRTSKSRGHPRGRVCARCPSKSVPLMCSRRTLRRSLFKVIRSPVAKSVGT